MSNQGSRGPVEQQRRPVEQYLEAIEVLFGDRSRSQKPAAAVRIRDLTGILQVPQSLAAKAAVGAPTKAEYDALLRDVTALSTALRIVADALQSRLTVTDSQHAG